MADKQAYSKAVKGKLSFKGAKVGIKKNPKRKFDDDNADDHDVKESGQQNTAAENKGTTNIEDASADEIKIVSGTGRLTSSGTTILGHGTSFMNELSHGDAIIVTHPSTYADETKIVRMVLSNISISVSSAFSTDLISTAPFRFIKAPKDPSSSSSAEGEGMNKKRMMTGKGQQDSEEAAFGEYVSQGTASIHAVRVNLNLPNPSSDEIDKMCVRTKSC
jgi:hypothetical protein